MYRNVRHRINVDILRYVDEEVFTATVTCDFHLKHAFSTRARAVPHRSVAVSYTHLDVYKRQIDDSNNHYVCAPSYL